ncbi:glucose-6-phosphate dehydrogenase [Aequorivita sp. H23M31]|uniref:Glucose-6-phosphate 1-dehydrogenase n=1 Tax=Aequorivita ciconiae TaxID=2494375 RepID=A0A410G791_9FLAO|nr:glucose-6-phosphate dehydrogenase [Aequorivita sp. H23M31]QAA83091.1 glucose-6-phosphate dehydrogenase [Aequorivita sp. H23M31]
MAKTVNHNTNTEPNSAIFIIFGGTGDLSRRKIFPALYNLFLENRLPEKLAIVGSGRSKLTDAKYRATLLDSVNEFSRRGKAKKEDWTTFASKITYQAANIKDVGEYKAFETRIKEYQDEWKEKPAIIYYCAVSPEFFCTIAENISSAKLENNEETTRIVIEKPFGSDLKSAQDLNHKLLTIFSEKQIYRIDHYLGKEVVQNIMAFRFANAIMEPLWNRNHIEHVQISVTEQIGVGSRGDYFEHAGILRDMIQNHLLQLLCIIAMEPPISFDADVVRDRKVEVLKAMRKILPGKIDAISARGQYGPGWVEGKKVPGYREEADVDPESNTETYAALKFYVDNWRWQGVPFYLRTGKRLFKTASLITIRFKEVPHNMFHSENENVPKQNRLVISIQPDMGILLQLESKIPGLEMRLNTVDMVFDYSGKTRSDAPEAYETLLLDIISGDQTLFMRADQVEAAWELIMPVLNSWENNKVRNFPNYPANSWGPENAEALIAQDGFHWFNLPENIKKE